MDNTILCCGKYKNCMDLNNCAVKLIVVLVKETRPNKMKENSTNLLLVTRARQQGQTSGY